MADSTFDLCIVVVDTASSAIGYLLLTDENYIYLSIDLYLVGQCDHGECSHN